MKFSKAKTNEFLEIFNTEKDKIRSFAGCRHVELLSDNHNPELFFTYSHWDSEDHLANYRNSDFFKATWSKTKQLFEEKAEAWTTTRLE